MVSAVRFAIGARGGASPGQAWLYGGKLIHSDPQAAPQRRLSLADIAQ